MALLPVCFYIRDAHHEFGLGTPRNDHNQISISILLMYIVTLLNVVMFGQGQGTPWWNTRGVENRGRHPRALPHRIRQNGTNL